MRGGCEIPAHISSIRICAIFYIILIFIYEKFFYYKIFIYICP